MTHYEASPRSNVKLNVLFDTKGLWLGMSAEAKPPSSAFLTHSAKATATSSSSLTETAAEIMKYYKNVISYGLIPFGFGMNEATDKARPK